MNKQFLCLICGDPIPENGSHLPIRVEPQVSDDMMFVPVSLCGIHEDCVNKFIERSFKEKRDLCVRGYVLMMEASAKAEKGDTEDLAKLTKRMLEEMSGVSGLAAMERMLQDIIHLPETEN